MWLSSTLGTRCTLHPARPPRPPAAVCLVSTLPSDPNRVSHSIYLARVATMPPCLLTSFATSSLPLLPPHVLRVSLICLSSQPDPRCNSRPPGIRSCMPPVPRALLLITSTPLPPPIMLSTSPHYIHHHLPLDYPMTTPRWATRTRTG